jgi:NAD(P)-dependent dehydrogenase (short-subunit alcohol dehydrogenase family)
MNTRRLEGKVAIVTGAGEGIGHAIALRFAREGAHVVVAEIKSDTVQRAAADCTAQGSEALAYPIDVGDVDAVRQMIKDVVNHFGKLDILVNNAGVSERAPMLELTPEQWDWLMRVNQRAVFFAMQAAARQMIAQIPAEIRASGRAPHSYGKIVNLSSIAGRRGRADAMHYSVSKAAVITMTQGTAMALAPYNINVNAICPSVVPTAMWERLDAALGGAAGLPPGEFYRQRVEKVPLKRAGTTEQIAAMATFLCSEEADYITGQTYNVDGGSELN